MNLKVNHDKTQVIKGETVMIGNQHRKCNINKKIRKASSWEKEARGDAGKDKRVSCHSRAGTK